jgi:hypothetical protein
MRLPVRRLAVLAVVSFALVAGCSSGDGIDEDEGLVGLVDDGQEPDDSDGPVDTAASELGGCNQCSNCVKYARCRQPRLPYGLTSFGEKLHVINSHTPRRGCVAVIQTSSVYGHVAYVNGVGGGRISIDEGNWSSGHCGQRSGTPAALNVRGYWCP